VCISARNVYSEGVAIKCGGKSVVDCVGRRWLVGRPQFLFTALLLLCHIYNWPV